MTPGFLDRHPPGALFLPARRLLSHLWANYDVRVTQPRDLPALAELDQLLADLGQLRGLEPLERARRAREMDTRVRGVVGRVGDEAVWQATNELVGTRRRSHKDVAEGLGVTPFRVSNAVSAYRRWTAERNGPDA